MSAKHLSDIFTFSAAAAEIIIDNTALTLGWDIWSGLFIMAGDTDGDRILDELERLLGDAAEEKMG